ncbi:MAG: hypothetical protein LBC35_02530 [Coriobacteriales bacterium]|nr:hypothetical protein [Coriobacteriales bacterium]
MRNQAKYAYYDATRRFQVQDDRRKKSELTEPLGIIKGLIDTTRAKISPSHIVGRADISGLLTNRAMNYAIKDALITGCSFLYVETTPQGVRLVPFSSYEATGYMRTDGMLSTALIQTSIMGQLRPVVSVSPVFGSTGGLLEAPDITSDGICALVPIVYNPNPTRPG